MLQSLPGSLVVTALDQIVAHVGATEIHGSDGGPFRSLREVEGDMPAGQVRVWTSALVPRIVYTNLDLPSKSMDSHMFYAFTPADSAVPHFTLDAVAAHGMHAFHADLMPRVDLSTHVDYMDAVFGDLDATHRQVDGDPVFLKAMVAARGRAMMSPWMLANRLEESTFAAATAPSQVYVDHWLALVEKGLPDTVVATLDDTDLVRRDAALRLGLFGRDIDPAWDMAAGLVGAEPITALRLAMQGAELS